MNFLPIHEVKEIGIAGHWFEVTMEVFNAYHGPKRIRNLSTGEIVQD